MDGISTAALEHIQIMEARIAQQTALIVELRRSGKDTLEATRRLALLHHALEEIRTMLGGLLPTEAQNQVKKAS